ncbi:CinA family nicotinamide mononucleotide deamidase-related protein [Epilithonimonas hungarica]|uniref:CinA-like protein n=1 Tax=Epilithonimonas hungarica TaxID=454006 RepID=A0A1G7NS26_9FLAO|nr:CinA family nicotinamide mononucleotide deamidase-related protein [Epilithonimonas hungarica]SDF76844.1 nicotinamide-nucleotide amidase [Epilithonimonas hungarica]
MKTAVLITIGDEILSGNTVDTNSNFIATQLKEIGIKVLSIFTIPDEEQAIVSTLGKAFEMADVVFTTGGLGPTKDDITKKAYAKFFEDEMIFSDAIYEHLRAYLEKRNRLWILEHNKDQAMVLSKAKIFLNYFGTAPCMILEKNGTYCFSLPGVPYEVKPLVKDQIIPFLKEKLSLDHIVTRIVSVVDIPESILSETIEEWELALPEHISLSYLPVGTRVKLRLTASGSSQELLNAELENEIIKLFPLIGENIIATQEDKIEKILSELLTDKKLTISVAESCTGGELAHLITSVAGSSNYFLGGVVTYATQKKIELLNVNPKTIEEFTVVSEEVASEMAIGCQKLFKTDISVSTTGVAGPGKGEDGKDVGTVFYSIRIENEEVASKLFLPHLERLDFMHFVSQKVIQDIVSLLIKK